MVPLRKAVLLVCLLFVPTTGWCHETAGDIRQSQDNAIVRAVRRVEPAVVSINTFHYKEYPRYRDPFFDYFFESPSIVRERIPGIGSGFVIREDGYILTNSHVVENAREIDVTFPDGRKYAIRDVAADVLIDREYDLAVIHIDVEGLDEMVLKSYD